MNPKSETLEQIAERFGVRMMLLFGSAVTGRTHADSDLDIAVELEDTRQSYRARGELACELQQLFPGRKIDLAVLNRADPLFLKKIVESCRMIFGDAARLQAMRIYAFRRYQDHAPYFAMEREYVRRVIAGALTQP